VFLPPGRSIITRACADRSYLPFGPGPPLAKSHRNYAESTVGSLVECQEFCEASVGCSFVVYQSASGACQVKLVDQTKYTRTIFSLQSNTAFLDGEIRNVRTLETVGDVSSVAACGSLCDGSGECQFATYDTSKSTCELKAFNGRIGESISFRKNPRYANDRPSTEGTMTSAGNTGIVAIAAGLLPNGKIIIGARPEYQRGGPNLDNVLSGSPTASGEISSLYDPSTETHVPIRVTDNLFCHGQVLTEDGDMFTAGGDADAYDGLESGLDHQRVYLTSLGTYITGKSMQRTRWYNTVVRTPVDTFWMIGGQANGEAYSLNPNMDIYTPGIEDSPNELVNVDLIARTYSTNYPRNAIIPGSGNVFLFAMNEWSILDKNTGAELERNGDKSTGYRGGDYPSATAILPMYAAETAAEHVCEFIWFGGGNHNYYADPHPPEITIASVARMVLTAETKIFTYDEPMPYGRFVSDALVQPNGKILIFNGGRYGRSRRDIARPNMFGTASEVFCFDPTKPYGSRWEVFAKAANRRFYHSSSVFLPDGTSITMGTDEATYDRTTAYDHEAERFTPPWLLDGSPRPVITSSPEGTIYYGTDFSFSYSGATVDRVTLMAPNSATHGTEMTQRTLFLTVVCDTGSVITVRAPVDATVMIKGYYMLFAVAGDTPSVAAWVKLGTAPAGYEFPALLPLDGSECLSATLEPSLHPTFKPSQPSAQPVFTPSARPSQEPSTKPSVHPLVMPTMEPSRRPTFNPSASPFVPAMVSASSCDDLGWTNAEKFGSSSVCGESDSGFGGCSAPMNRNDALALCESAGARLCSVEELQANEVRGTGCGYDSRMVWSRDTCEGGFTVAYGATTGGSETSCLAASEEMPARCCADIGEQPPPVPAPTKAPSPVSLHPAVLVSASSCEQLGWSNAQQFGTSLVCGESDRSLGGCSGFLSWPAARDFCEQSGARMCSLEELQADETRSTGCGYDKEELWSRSSCEGGFSLGFGASFKGDETECLASPEAHPVRCCADSVPEAPVPAPTRSPSQSPGVVTFSSSTCDDLGWTNAEKYGSSSVCGESWRGLSGCSGELSWSVAIGFCEGIGARLCTVEELQADETKSTGCG